ncbi:MAG: hypothetical protein IJK29_07865 [Bacteroidales bacterium]|nr:hypothetical protein [Bacteroidales bacterium]
MKVKFTKLAALLLAGVALFATGCTDYEVDIQKVDKKVDNLTSEVNNKIASLEQQIAGINATIATLETKAAHDADIQTLRNELAAAKSDLQDEFNGKINKAVADLTAEINKKVNQADYDVDKAAIEKAIKDVNDALNAAKDRIKALEDADYQGQIDAAKDRIKALEDAHFQDQIDAAKDRITKLENLLAGDWDGKTVKETIDALAETVADLEIEVNGKISALDERLTKAEAAIKKINEETIPALQGQVDDINNVKIPALQQDIQDLKDGKLDKAEFEKYKEATANTIRLMQEAIQNLADTKVDKTEFDAKVAEILAKFDDYVLKTTFEAFKAIVGTEDELKNFEGTIIGRLKACEALLAGEWGDKTVQEYIDAKDKALQDQLDKIVNELIPALDKRVKDLEKSVNEVILPQLKFALDYEGGLKAYIDDNDAKTLAAAKDYTDAEVQKVRDELNKFKAQMYDLLHQLASRIQSIVYVPDYDDLKITSNMAKTTVPGVEGALYIDQPTTITYKILPAEYAAAVVDLAKASEFKDLLFFDVKTVNTRADEEADVEPAFQIIAAEKDANIDENGLVTFTVLPVNVASAAFAATAIPVEFNAVFGNVANVFGFDVPYLWADGEYVYPVVKEEDLEAYLARTAFAASLRFVTQDITIPSDPASEEYNEVASTYNVLYPGISHIVDVPAESFKKEPDGTLREFTEDERHLKLPYNSPDTKIILDQAVPGYVIDGDLMSYEQASEAGIVVPKYDIQFPTDEDIVWIDNNGNQKKDDYIVATGSYVKVNMNLDADVAARMFEIGNQVAATYVFKSEVGEFSDEGDVTITKELGEIAVSANAVWTWDWNKDGVVELDGEPVDLGDALIDHNRYYKVEQADTNYVRMVWPVDIDEAGFAKLQADLGIELEDFAGLTPNVETFKIEVADRLNAAGEEIADEELVFEALADDAAFEIANVAIKDGKLYADFLNFEWDKVYKVTAEYELQYAVITVNGIFKTYDRNREPVTINKYEYTFGINEFDEETGNGYKPGADGAPGYYYYKSPAMKDNIFAAFVENGIIDVNPAGVREGFADFEDVDAFWTGELYNRTETYEEDGATVAGTANKYVIIRKTDGTYAETRSNKKQISAKDLLAMNSGVQSDDDPYVFLGNELYRYITSYIGEKIVIPFQFNYRVPAYDFLHQTNYTFDDGQWYSMASPKYDVNKKSLKKYDVEYMNVPALAFNIVDKNKRYFNYKDEPIADDDPQYFYNDSLKINFYYTDPEMDETDIEEQSATDELKKYGQLWFNAYDQAAYYQVEEAKNFEHTVFYYRSTRDAIPMFGTLEIACDGVRFPIPTSFEENNGGKYVASEIRGEETDYSNFELRAWKPFYVPTYTRELEVKLDEHGKYVVNVLEGLQFFDGREVAASTPLDEVKDPFVEGTYRLDAFNNGTTSYFRPMLGFNEDPQGGEPVWGWVVGDADSTNGYYPGVSSWDAYDLQEKSFVFSKDGVPMDLRRLIDIDEETYTMTFDYNSQIQFYDTATISFGFDLQSPWQKFAEPFKVNVVIKGLNAQ